MKQIIFVHLLNDFSGSPKVLSQVLDAIKRDGQEPVLYTGKGESGFLSNKTSKHKNFYYKRSENRYITLFNFMLSQQILFFKLLKYFNKDVVIYVNTMLPFGAGLAGLIMRKPVYYHVHEISLTPVTLKRFLRGIIQLTAQKVIYVSEAVKALETFKNKRSYVIHNALPSEFARKNDDLNPHTFAGQFNILMIGSLKAYKGVYEFLEIAERLRENTSLNFNLMLNAEKDEIDSFFKDMSISTNVSLIPRQKNVVSFYKNANLVLNLSRIDKWVETFGLTIIEALAFGIPVIVPPVGGPAEIVRNGKEGYLISSYEIEEIVRKIQMLSNDKNKWEELSKNALKRSLDFSEERFNMKIMASINA